MKQELEAPEELTKRLVSGQRVMGIDWIDSKAATPVTVKVVEAPAEPEVPRKGGRWLALRDFVLRALGNVVMFVCLIGLFGFYTLSCLGHSVGLQQKKPSRWTRMKRLNHPLGLVLLFALAIAFTGCVGYVGPDYGPGYVGGPDFYVFGGGYYHGHYAHAYAARGAVSRGFGGHGGFAGHGGGHR